MSARSPRRPSVEVMPGRSWRFARVAGIRAEVFGPAASALAGNAEEPCSVAYSAAAGHLRRERSL